MRAFAAILCHLALPLLVKKIAQTPEKAHAGWHDLSFGDAEYFTRAGLTLLRRFR